MAKGSHATRGGWEPKHCHVCHQPVRVSKDTAWFHYSHTRNEGFAWHMNCNTRIDWNQTR